MATGTVVNNFLNQRYISPQEQQNKRLLNAIYNPLDFNNNQPPPPPPPPPKPKPTTIDGQNINTEEGWFDKLMNNVFDQKGSSALAVGSGLGLLQEYVNNQDSGSGALVKQKQPWLDRQESNAIDNREKLLAENPEANRRAAAMQLQSAMSNAQQGALNSATASSRNQGIGGDIGFAASSGAKSVAASMGANAPYAQALAGLQAQKSAEENKIDSLLSQNINDSVGIEAQRLYTKDDSGTRPMDFLNSAMGGINVMDKMHNLLNKGDLTVETTNEDVDKAMNNWDNNQMNTFNNLIASGKNRRQAYLEMKKNGVI